ncbi:hypothetical protein G3I40_31005 [Streptomyces sp. SID14478]|nr:hypothetical protein [Streptomyces sp. SID14478]
MLVVDVLGVFDGGAATQLCGLLVRMARTGQRAFVVDFERAAHCDPAGARQFVETMTRTLRGESFLAVVPGTVAGPALALAGADGLSGGSHGRLADAVAACGVLPLDELGEPAS